MERNAELGITFLIRPSPSAAFGAHRNGAFQELLDEYHYLGSLKAVGERLHYVATDA
jgi:hypothetical protein